MVVLDMLRLAHVATAATVAELARLTTASAERSLLVLEAHGLAEFHRGAWRVSSKQPASDADRAFMWSGRVRLAG